MSVHETPWPAGTPCWIDLNASDLETAKAFYADLFGWQFQVGGEETGGYVIAEVGGRAVAGLMGAMPGQEPQAPAWTTYFAADDADATAAKITEAGGTVVVAPMDVLDIGRMAVAVDPTGGAFGLWQARTFTGAQLANEPGSFTWNELVTRDFERATAFYRAVFGYTFTDMSGGGMQYCTIDIDGRPVGGLGSLPAEVPDSVPAHWRVYFAVDDADTTLEHAVKLGGTLLRPAEDMPYGRWGDAADPQGASFSVIKPAPPPD